MSYYSVKISHLQLSQTKLLNNELNTFLLIVILAFQENKLLKNICIRPTQLSKQVKALGTKITHG